MARAKSMPEEIEENHLLYEPPPTVHQSFWDAYERIVPLSPNGTDRRLKYFWGCDVVDYVSGRWVRRFADTDNEPPKYVGRCRWVLCGWQSPDVYNRDEWKVSEHLLGPFPETGVWDFLEFHETYDTQEFLPLDDSAIARLEGYTYWAAKGDKRSIEFLMEQKMLRWALQEKNRQEAADAVAMNFGEQYVKLTEHDPNPVSTSGGGAFKKTAGGILVPV